MNKLNKFMSKVALEASNKFSDICFKLKEKKGISELAVVVLLIIVAVVITGSIFMPQISKWFTETVMPALKSTTEKMFSFAG